MPNMSSSNRNRRKPKKLEESTTLDVPTTPTVADADLVNTSLSKFVDQRNRVNYKATQNDMRLIECKNSAFQEIAANRRRYATGHRDINDDGDLFEIEEITGGEFRFREREDYDRYLELCEQRDSIPELPKTRIAELRSKDPVFAKRYRDYLTHRAKYRAPRFEKQVNQHLPPVQRANLSRYSSRYLKEMSQHKKVNLPMLRMHSAIEKTHVFMEQFKN
jgi:hypothetical protein